jgi:hypothetical protein
LGAAGLAKAVAVPNAMKINPTAIVKPIVLLKNVKGLKMERIVLLSSEVRNGCLGKNWQQ